MLSTATDEGSSLPGMKGGCIGIPKVSGVALKPGGPLYSPTIAQNYLLRRAPPYRRMGVLLVTSAPSKTAS